MTAPESAVEPPAAPGPWSPAQRLGFRFVFAYLVAYCFPVPEGLVDLPWNPIDKGWHAFIPWFGAHVLHLAAPIAVQETGSGDRMYDFVKLLCTTSLAVVGTLVWSVLDRRRTEYRSLHAWLRVYVRYALAISMVGYGVAKVFCLQFPFPRAEQLAEPYGDGSPMGLLWTFMGFAPAYETFAGAAELLGGALLFFRRTTTLGALVVVGVMSNVVMMNFCYDVPVKLGSTHLLLMAVFLVAADLERLARFFVLNRATEPAAHGPTLSKRWQARTRIGLKIAVIGYVLYANVAGTLEVWKEYGPGAKRGPLEGGYDVETFVRNGETVPPLPADGSRWKRVVVYPGGYARVQMMDKTGQSFRAQEDEAAGTLTLTKFDESGSNPAPPAVFHYTRPDPETVALQGTLGDAPLEVRLKKLDASKMPLVSRGFHWIQEFPYNR